MAGLEKQADLRVELLMEACRLLLLLNDVQHFPVGQAVEGDGVESDCEGVEGDGVMCDV